MMLLFDSKVPQRIHKPRQGKAWPRSVRAGLLLLVFVVAGASSAAALEITIDPADFDRWNYPFNGTPGFRGLAPTFSAVGSPSFDDMDGQFLVGFNTAAAGLPVLGPGESYQVNSVRVTATHFSGAFTYDPTFDNYASHLPGADPDFVADADAGRPIELYGAGLGGGFAGFGFAGGVTGPPIYNDGSPFAFADPTLPNVRNAFAFDPLAGNVSNAVEDRLFGTSAWAVGQAEGLSPGDAVPQGVSGVSSGQTFTFDIDLAKPGVLAYLTTGLENGGLFFTIASLHDTDQGGGSNPNFYTSNNFDPFAVPPTLELDVEIVPEPSSVALAVVGAAVACLAGVARRRRR